MPVKAESEQQHGYKHASGYGVDAVLDTEVANRPHCEHGPTLLFERFFKDKTSRKFFACSACRDRKQCTFFQWEDEKITEGKALMQKSTAKLFKKRKDVHRVKAGDYWCFECAQGYPSTLLVDAAHAGHTMKVLDEKDVALPTKFLNPMDAKKAKAQYFFAEETLEMLQKNIKKLEYKNVICIGTPRLFEVVREDPNISAVLLDLDTRFEHFFSSSEYFKYNMFNHFFFDLKGGQEKQFNSFVASCKPEETLLVVDPPFGGLVDVLQNTLSKIWKLFGVESVATMLVFPYFLESHVMRSSPSLLMHDYKVCYTNHPTYRPLKPEDKQQRGSPVRIFTNIESSKLSFPTNEYRFCKICQRYVYKANRHCKHCNACTSKDGRTYVHCKQCKTCVKQNLQHCDTCTSCKQEKHVCGETVAAKGCHVCGDVDHKRKDCPKKVKAAPAVKAGKNRKRKAVSSEGEKGKKKRKMKL